MAPRSISARFPRRPLSVRETQCWPGRTQPGPGLSLRAHLSDPRRVLTLTRLTCTRTEDTFGRDEVRLEVWLDGQFDDSLRFRLRDGGHKDLASRYEFNESARVVLYDEDTSTPSDLIRLDRDDLLGSHAFAGPGAQQRRFTRDGADYTLDATVADGAPGPATDAYDLLDDFERSTAPGRWPQLDKQAIIDQVAERLREPWTVNQGPTNNCGPAAVLVELVRRSPRRYVRLVRDLFERGRFRLKNGDSVTASMRLRHAPARSVPDDDGDPWAVPDADWLVLASLRESANAVLSGPDSFDTGGSTHWEVAGWLWNLCGYNRIDYFPGIPGMVGNALTPWDTPAQRWLDVALDVLGRDGCAVASIDTSILGTRVPDWWSLPNHLVLLLDSQRSSLPGCTPPEGLGPLHVTGNGFVEWTIATWGDLDRETTHHRDFESGMWILITGH